MVRRTRASTRGTTTRAPATSALLVDTGGQCPQIAVSIRKPRRSGGLRVLQDVPTYGPCEFEHPCKSAYFQSVCNTGATPSVRAGGSQPPEISCPRRHLSVVAALQDSRLSVHGRDGLTWAEIGGKFGQRNLSVTADRYTHVLLDPRGVDRPKLLTGCVWCIPRCRPRRWLHPHLQGRSRSAPPIREPAKIGEPVRHASKDLAGVSET